MKQITTYQQRLRLAVSMADMGLIEIDYEKDTAIADERAATIFDLQADVPLARKEVHERFHPADRAIIEQKIRDNLDPQGKGHFSMDHRVLRRDGSVRWLNVRKQVFFEEVGGQLRPVSGLLAAVDITHRKRVEEQMRQSRDTLGQLVEENPFGVYVIDSNFRVCYASAGARKAFANIRSLIGHDFADAIALIWPKNVAQEVIDRFRHTLLTGATYHAPQLTHQRADIDLVESYEWKIKRIKLPDEQYGVVCYYYDATERQNWEQSLRESETRFRRMTDASPAVVWVTDVNHQCTFLSRGWYENTGQEPDSGLGLGWLDMIHPDDREDAKRVILTAMTQREPFEYDYRLRTPDGSYRWALDSGRPIFASPSGSTESCQKPTGESANDPTDVQATFEGYVGSVIDVHERHSAQESLSRHAAKLERSESRLQMAAEATGFGTYELDVLTGDAVWSDEMFRITGVNRDRPVSPDQMETLVHPLDLSRFRELVSSLRVPAGPDRYQSEFRIVRPDGQTRWVADSARVYHDESEPRQNHSRIVGTLQDITDRKLFEQSLQRAKRAAEAANRSRGEFLANMSHEIRTPMSAILGHADILRDHLKDPDNIQVVETIRRNGRFLLEIINDILDLSKIDAGKLEIERAPMQPDRLVAEVRSLMDVRASEKGLPLTIEFKNRIPEKIESDPVRLRQVLVNLLGNAIKFTDDGNVRLVISYDEDRQRLTFDVIDTGIGIRRDDLNRIFEPFKQADNSATRSFGGTGLGLAICRRLAEALGGQVTARSKLGDGSQFTLSIDAPALGPLIQPNLSLDRRGESDASQVQLTGHYLIVDDRRDIRYLAQHFIEKAGGTVTTATNGREAVEAVMSPSTTGLDLIVMDMQMPVMDGYEATRELRRRGCELPIIALTANAMKSDRDQCLAAGCTDYTTKPLDRDYLIQLIDRLTIKKTTQPGGASNP
ncbi:PAS domain-containing hybrid sensor histidine kinase/response regulator [Neorhodopirellula pilleata]|uniref:histidine kinase n=1 Tax=Neorhodopirellula pilleata TaxID=2714738 RepID=A0A5C6AWU7_9BACT|nr:PAS domain-containing hybrid sensor histidine kinase/response regulator [Neorhodopirellula pilleata]TWU03546.1 Autoinducer 2 sensor kinase/phosphatase LuxQ [Neorhodopirellula pilleata]